MGFKLIRLDSDEPTKIPLKVGTHIIGRGSFLNCDDQRVSRRHGVLKVTESFVLLKSLHQNPCFFNKQELKKSALLPQGKSIPLSNSDHFGLLPNTYWYQIMLCDDNNQSNIPLQVHQDNLDTTQNGNEETRVLTGFHNSGTQEVSYETFCDDGSDSEILNLEFDETMEDNTGAESQSLLNDNPVPSDPTTTPNELNTSLVNQFNGDETHCNVTPSKRSHTPDLNHESKKVKTEPESPETKDQEINNAESRRSEIGSTSPNEDNLQDTANITVQNAMDLNTNPTDIEQTKDSNAESNVDTDISSPSHVDTDISIPSNVDTDISSPSNEVKKEPRSPTAVKAEPLSPKKEKKDPDVAKPGPSNDQPGSSNDGGAAPKPPHQPVRERCIYGASCYSPVDDCSRRRRVNYAQQEVLAQFLESNRDLAVSFNKNAKARELCKRRWETAAELLNAQIDGSVKDWKGWSSYWVDYKAKFKKKVAAVRSSENKGPDALSLNDVEEKFVSILGDAFWANSSTSAKTTTSGIKLGSLSSREVKDPQSQNKGTIPRTLPPRHSNCRPLRRPRNRHMTEEAARRFLVEIGKASHEETRRNGIALENILYQVTRIADAFERKNPQHKAQFSHPNDSDHGTGSRGTCPYGASCRRRDPRHWALHDHPPGTRAPGPGAPGHQPGIRVVERRGQIFYVNAHTVHFHDDHMELEDEDGDSVDFDYEF